MAKQPEEIAGLVQAKFREDSVVEIDGPMQIGRSSVWEVVVRDRRRMIFSRFLEEAPGGTPHVYDSFQALARRLNDLQREALLRQEAPEPPELGTLARESRDGPTASPALPSRVNISKGIPTPLAFAGIGMFISLLFPGRMSVGQGFLWGLLFGFLLVAIVALKEPPQSSKSTDERYVR